MVTFSTPMPRKPKLLKTLSSIVTVLYGLCVLVPFFCVADQAFGHWGKLPANATLLCLLAVIPFSVVSLLKGIHQRNIAYIFTPMRLNAVPLGAFLFIACASLLLSIHPTAHWDEGGKWIFLLSYGFGIATLSLAIGQSEVMVRYLPFFMTVSVTLLLGSVWYDLIHPGSFAEIHNRAAGFPGNANFTALVAVLLCAAGLHYGERSNSRSQRSYSHTPVSYTRTKRARSQGTYPLGPDLLLLLLTFGVVISTMSRSGLVNFSVLLATFVYFRFMRSHYTMAQRAKGFIALGICAFFLLSLLPLIATYISSTQGNNRLSRFLNNQQVDDGSAGTRFAAVQDSIRLIEESPFVGHGTGFSRTMFELPHNLYLQQWVNNGIPGIAGFLAFLTIAYYTFARRGFRRGQAFMLVAITGSIFSHNLLDQRPFLILFGILLTSSVVGQPAPSTEMSRTPRQNAPRRSVVRPPAWEGSATLR